MLVTTRRFLTALTLICGIVHPSLAAEKTVPAIVHVTADGIPLVLQLERIALSDGNTLLGAVVTPSGQPVVGAPIVVSQFGKTLHQVTTGPDGRFAVYAIVPGTYQIASFAKAQSYQLCQASESDHAKRGIVHVMNEATVRANGNCSNTCSKHGQCQNGCNNCNCQPASRWGCLSSAASHPSLMVGMLLGGAIIGLAGLDDEAS